MQPAKKRTRLWPHTPYVTWLSHRYDLSLRHLAFTSLWPLRTSPGFHIAMTSPYVTWLSHRYDLSLRHLAFTSLWPLLTSPGFHIAMTSPYVTWLSHRYDLSSTSPGFHIAMTSPYVTWLSHRYDLSVRHLAFTSLWPLLTSPGFHIAMTSPYVTWLSHSPSVVQSTVSHQSKSQSAQLHSVSTSPLSVPGPICSLPFSFRHPTSELTQLQHLSFKPFIPSNHN